MLATWDAEEKLADGDVDGARREAVAVWSLAADQGDAVGLATRGRYDGDPGGGRDAGHRGDAGDRASARGSRGARRPRSGRRPPAGSVGAVPLVPVEPIRDAGDGGARK